jgi:hypothetical protein
VAYRVGAVAAHCVPEHRAEVMSIVVILLVAVLIGGGTVAVVMATRATPHVGDTAAVPTVRLVRLACPDCSDGCSTQASNWSPATPRASPGRSRSL